MDKQGSHTNQPDRKNHQTPSSAEGMSTHGEIHKQSVVPGSASVSLDQGVTSALSRAPSPFGQNRAEASEPPTPYTAENRGAHDHSPPEAHPHTSVNAGHASTQDLQNQSQARQEPHFGAAHHPQTPADPHAVQHIEPSFDDMYAHDHHAEMDSENPAHSAPESVQYPAQYQHYQDGMNDVFDEASEKPETRRTSFMLLAALGLVAIIAGGVIYFYKSTTSGVASKEEVPVVKAENQPTKVTPEKPGGIEIPHQKKLIYDRITGNNSEGTEQLVSRQEPVAPVSQPNSTGNPFDQQAASTPSTPPASGENNSQVAKAMLPPGANSPSGDTVNTPLNSPVNEPEVQTTTPVEISPPPALQTSAPAAAQTGSGDYLIQIASFRSQEEAVRNYENLSRRYAGLLSSYGPMIQRADLGSRGIYYRLRIGPMDSKQTASNLCSNLIAQGQKDCLVRRK